MNYKKKEMATHSSILPGESHDGGAWWAKNRTRMSDFTFTFTFMNYEEVKCYYLATAKCHQMKKDNLRVECLPLDYKVQAVVKRIGNFHKRMGRQILSEVP